MGQINRIYQGRVTKAEILPPGGAESSAKQKNKKSRPADGSWRDCPEWKDMLLRHHILFQDAVNYYLTAFAALAANPNRPSDQNDCPIHKLRGQMKEKWDDFNHKGVLRKGMRKSAAKYLCSGSDKKPLSFENCMEKILEGNHAPPEALHKALTSLLKHCSGSSSIQKQGRAFAPAFFRKGYAGQGAYKEGERGREKAWLFKAFAKNLWDSNISDEKLAKEACPEALLNLSEKEPYKGEKLRKKLTKALESLKKTLKDKGGGANQEKIKTLEALIEKKTQEGLEIPSYRGGGGKTGLRSNAFILFKYIEPGVIAREFLRKAISRPKDESSHQALNAKNSKQPEKRGSKGASAKAQKADLSVNGKDPIKISRGKRGYVFPAFTALLKAGKSDLGDPLWNDFDISAFKEALTVIHQIDHKTKEREAEKAKKQKALEWMEKRQWTKKDADGKGQIIKKWQRAEGEDELPFIGRFKESKEREIFEDANPDDPGDPRVRRLRGLLEFDLADEYFGEDDGVGKIPYGLRRRTLRGFGEIQKKWRRILNKKAGAAEADKSLLENKLKKELDSFQQKNKYSIGSAPLFNELLKPENWLVWKEPSKDKRKEHEEKGFAENPLDALCEYYELKEDIEKLEAPVKFTPADPEHSRRLFRFGDACSWPKIQKGKKTKAAGEHGHDENSLSFRAPIMAKTEKGWEKRTVKLHYAAPRLFRDELRKESNEALERAPWIQPMMKALDQKEPSEQDFWSCNVQLMPDKARSGKWRHLLNFPMKIDIKLSSRSALWEKNCKAGGNKYLKWPQTSKWAGDKKMSQADWFQKTDSFCCLSIDLGQRTAGAFAVISAGAGQKNGRIIGEAGGKKWRAAFKAAGVFRLPGEGMKLFQKGELKTEPSGSKGRPASEKELKEAEDIIAELCGGPAVNELLGGAGGSGKSGRENLSFPELNDKLLLAARRGQGQLSQHFRWAWMLGDRSKPEKKKKALEEIKKQEEKKIWSDLAKKGEIKAQHLQKLIEGEIPRLQKIIAKNLLLIAGRILPLRDRKWEWIEHPQKKDCHLLRQADFKSGAEGKKIKGQRGLSMRRIEQIEELRRRFQSLNQTQRRKIASPPLKLSEMRKNPIPDPCPDLLKKLEEIKKQRINQTAHLILAEALGVRLKPPSLPEGERRKKDIHGEYKKIREPVDFIVIEDLSRYKMRQDRPPRENSRLMQWSHRAVTAKLKKLCEPCGIPVLKAVAAYSSRFCSRSGAPGFRAAEVTYKDKCRWPYKDWLKKEEKEDSEEKNRREFLEELFQKLKGDGKQTGLVPKTGGPIFVPIKDLPPESGRPARNLGVIQADINAAVNIGLRAIASPLAEKIHHRVRSERKGDKIIVKSSGSIEKRRYTGETEICCRDKDKVSKNSDFFIDLAGAANFEKAEIQGVKYASGKGIWTAVRESQRDRCREFNNKRLNQKK